jgi:hypothetical protein
VVVEAIARRAAELVGEYQAERVGYLDVAGAADFLACPTSRIYAWSARSACRTTATEAGCCSIVASCGSTSPTAERGGHEQQTCNLGVARTRESFLSGDRRGQRIRIFFHFRGPDMSRPGREPTRKLIDQLCELRGSGLSIADACSAAGLSTSTWYRWQRQGEAQLELRRMAELGLFDLTPEEEASLEAAVARGSWDPS